MRHFTISLLLLCLGASLVTSCIDSSSIDEDRLIIDPLDFPMFEFDAEGVPYRWQRPEFTAEMQAAVKNELIGYGWQWMQTHEILETGYVDSKEYYESIIGPSPSSYYIESDSVLTRYFASDALHKDCFLQQGYTLDVETGLLSDGCSPSGIIPWSFYLRIWSIFQHNGRWFIMTVEPLATRIDEAGKSCTVWGVSQYGRMNSGDLQQMQRTYTYDYSQVN